MEALEFVWSEKKNLKNRRKHNVSFEEAQTVFFDDNAIEYFDPEHSKDENRFILLGMDFHLRVLVVCYCYRKDDLIVRIISARKATKKEKKAYPGG